MKTREIWKIRIGRKKDGLKFDSLAYADDLAIFTESYEEAVIRIDDLKKRLKPQA